MEPEPIAQYSDEYLVHCSRSDSEYFGYLINRFDARLRRYIVRLGVRNEEDQQDVLQEIFIKAYRGINGFDTSLSFSSWIYRIAHNESISWYRKASVRPEGHTVVDGDDILALMGSADTSAEVTFDQSVNAEAIKTALQKIDEKYRIILMLRYFEHKEYNEISDILQVPVGSVGTLLHRGKKALAKQVQTEAIRL